SATAMSATRRLRRPCQPDSRSLQAAICNLYLPTLWAPAAAQPPDLLSSSNSAEQQQQPPPSASASKSVAKNFLSEHGNLVNLDSLLVRRIGGRWHKSIRIGAGRGQPVRKLRPGLSWSAHSGRVTAAAAAASLQHVP
uniref:CELR2 protein n=1 Tax=Macrostomum lignano TaxID=282301 RepID=A0A1I8HPY5_9PLAT